ncbi:MAG: DNA methyltransferase, partial [Anaerovoracaceae bacterium]
TKEDITEYIGKNCIIPFLVDEVAKSTSRKDFKASGFVWQMLKDSGDKYIYDAVSKGCSKPLPDYIEQGVDTTTPDLLERRARWNEKTHEELALPTEIWRETIERRNRYFDVRSKIERGEINEINDFVTYNLDIRSFVYDLIAKTDDHLFVKHFYEALQKVTILDPTCGSGAFLFAAMNILEPLYEVCIDRMIEFNSKNDKLFTEELREIQNKYRSNIQHFIYKSIILRNLYGVDIMVEATEIAKLRLFLKMVAVVDVDRRADNLGLDPLPDIDFNIRCGNTLVGYATKDELMRDVTFGDIFARAEFEEKIELEMQKVAKAYELFKEIQINQHDNIEEFKQAKGLLQSRLKELNELLNRKMYASVSKYTYEEWLSSHKPFHWLAEFYQIIQGNGGFDVIIGNPPYVEYSKIKDNYAIVNYKTQGCGNLYGFIIERCNKIISSEASFGMIIPISFVCTQRMRIVQNELLQNGNTWISNYAERPSKLFIGAEVLLSIFVHRETKEHAKYTTGFTKWKSEGRDILFKKIQYNKYNHKLKNYIEPKLSSEIESNIVPKIMSKGIFAEALKSKTDHKVFYRIGGGRYWKVFTCFSPEFILNGNKTSSSRESTLNFETSVYRNAAISILSSTFFYWYFVITTNCRDLNPSDLKEFPLSLIKIEDDLLKTLSAYSSLLMDSYERNSQLKEKTSKQTGRIKYQEFYPKLSKPTIDDIDKVLAQHYGFTDEELDFIINYDIKYRMGSELDNDNE